jgi:hypothetical protein
MSTQAIWKSGHKSDREYGNNYVYVSAVCGPHSWCRLRVVAP